MFQSQPLDHVLTKLADESGQFCRVVLAGGAHVVVFHSISFVPARIQVIGVLTTIVAKNQRHGLDGAIMMAPMRGPIPFRIQQDAAKLEGGVVGDAKPPVRRDAPLRVPEIAVHDCQ